MAEINSKHYAEICKEELKEDIKNLKSTPKLMIINAKDYYEPSKIYINNKMKTSQEIGIESTSTLIEWEGRTKEDLINTLTSILDKNLYDGVATIIQLPFPQLSYKDVAELMDQYSSIDVDGISNKQQIKLINNDKTSLVPATALGVMKLLKYVFNNNLQSKSISIFSRSELIGKPLLQMALNENMTPTVIHSNSSYKSKKEAFASDIIITGCGKRKLFNSLNIQNDMATIIDCSMDKIEGIRGVGDCDKEDILSSFPYVNIASGYGHTGIFTVLGLMSNVIKAHKINDNGMGE